MKHLILVKHSLPETVTDVPACDWVLSNEGKRRAQVLADELRVYQPEVIISSTEPKAVQTAEILAKVLELEMRVAENLHEHERSKAAFLSQEAFEAKVHEFFNQPNELRFGSETADQSYDRFRRAVNYVLNEYQNQTIVIVSHGTVISLFVSRIQGSDPFPLWKELGLPSFVLVDIYSETILGIENIR